MHVVMAIIGAISAGVFWWYRLRNVGQVASEAVNTAQRIKGNIKRKRFRAKAQLSAFDAIDDPIVAAATLALATAEECCVDLDDFAPAFSKRLETVSSQQAIEEAMIYGKWAIRDAGGSASAARIIGPKLAGFLNVEERDDYVQMVQQSLQEANANNDDAANKVVNLRRQLGFTV